MRLFVPVGLGVKGVLDSLYGREVEATETECRQRWGKRRIGIEGSDRENGTTEDRELRVRWPRRTPHRKRAGSRVLTIIVRSWRRELTV